MLLNARDAETLVLTLHKFIRYEVRDPSDLSRSDTASYVDDASGSRVQITDHTGE